MRVSTLLLCVSVLPGWAQQPAPVPSPEVQADRRVTFRLLAPRAAEVRLTGEFLEGSRALEKDEKGLWSVTVGPLEPEIYHYNFTIDGVRTIDPGNPAVKSGSTPATLMSILEVRGDSPAFYDGQAVPHGLIRSHWYPSQSLHSLRRLTVYTPPGYDGNTQIRYPVLYLFHGANADETAWTRYGRVNLILDNLLAAGKIRPFVVVMPFGYGVAPATNRPPSGGAPSQNNTRFGEDLLQDVLPLIESQYRVYTDRDHRAVAGLSMGGGQSLTIGLSHLELFSQVAGFSAAIRSTDFDKTFADLASHPQETNRKLRLLWIGCGKQDSLLAANQGFSQFLKAHQVQHVFRETDGAHTWMVWRRYLHEFAPLLFR